jgi:hypothetical protein
VNDVQSGSLHATEQRSLAKTHAAGHTRRDARTHRKDRPETRAALKRRSATWVCSERTRLVSHARSGELVVQARRGTYA